MTHLLQNFLSSSGSVFFPLCLSFPCLFLPLFLSPYLCLSLCPSLVLCPSISPCWPPVFLSSPCPHVSLSLPRTLPLSVSIPLGHSDTASPASSRNSVCQSVCVSAPPSHLPLSPPDPPPQPAAKFVRSPAVQVGTRFSQGPPPPLRLKYRRRGARSWGGWKWKWGGQAASLRAPIKWPFAGRPRCD